MGQYWIPVSLTKREFVHPHKLGAGLKLWEQLATHPGTTAALVILTAAMPQSRGGDITDNESADEKVVGRWAGDRIALIGDYAERDDLKPEDNADLIYNLCDSEDRVWNTIARREESGQQEYAARLQKELDEKGVYTDVSEGVAKVIERELGGHYEGDGWRTFVEGERVECGTE